jgi:hypothetical protein
MLSGMLGLIFSFFQMLKFIGPSENPALPVTTVLVVPEYCHHDLTPPDLLDPDDY